MLKRLLFACLFFKAQGLYAQYSFTDTAQVSIAEHYLKDYYLSQRGNESALYNGRLHYAYPSGIEGIAYFQTDAWQKGTVIYENVIYENILMKYDLVKDQLIITAKETGGVNISLFSPRVQEFSFGGSKFVYLTKAATKSMADGFYQQLAQGKVTAFAKPVKVITETIVSTTLYRKFEEKIKYYILKNGQYYPVNNKNDLLNILREHRKEIQDLLSAQGLNYRRDPQTTLTSAVQLYNQREN